MVQNEGVQKGRLIHRKGGHSAPCLINSSAEIALSEHFRELVTRQPVRGCWQFAYVNYAGPSQVISLNALFVFQKSLYRGQQSPVQDYSDINRGSKRSDSEVHSEVTWKSTGPCDASHWR